MNINRGRPETNNPACGDVHVASAGEHTGEPELKLLQICGFWASRKSLGVVRPLEGSNPSPPLSQKPLVQAVSDCLDRYASSELVATEPTAVGLADS
jgi:hypothetical protein